MPFPDGCYSVSEDQLADLLPAYIAAEEGGFSDTVFFDMYDIDGNHIDIGFLDTLNRMAGKGWFRCIVKDGILYGLGIKSTPQEFRRAARAFMPKSELSEICENDRLSCSGCGAAISGIVLLATYSKRRSARLLCDTCDRRYRERVAAIDGTMRRIREHYAEGSHTEEEWRELLSLYGGKCVKCGTSEDITKDHITPLSSNGTNYIENIQPLCRRCNSRKGTRDIDYRPTVCSAVGH